MICPSCKREIEDGKLLCEYCGAEIRIVPEFDSRVEASIEETMHAITDDLSKEEELEKRRRERMERIYKRQKKALLAMTGLVLSAIIIGGIAAAAFFHYRRSESYYIGTAYKKAEEGIYDEAATFVQKALDTKPNIDISLLLLKEQYESLSGNEEAVLQDIQKVLATNPHSEQDEIAAYGHYITLCEAKGEYDKISAFLLNTGNETLLSRYRDYIVDEVSFDTPGGNYEGVIHVSIRSHYDEEIYYRMEGTGAAGEETLYTEPIELSDGEYTIIAYTKNRFNVKSGESAETYIISRSKPKTPVIYPPSGTYHDETEVFAEEDETDNGVLYYTTDGSDPSEESIPYEGPIIMPVGTSHFRFAYIGEDGETGEIVEASFVRSEGNTFTESDGIQSILLTLMQLGEVIDPSGTVAGGNAVYGYQYLGLHEIEDRGSFFLYHESMIDSSGVSTLTGRAFAVNVNSGAVYLYNEPSPGNYVLVPTA